MIESNHINLYTQGGVGVGLGGGRAINILL